MTKKLFGTKRTLAGMLNLSERRITDLVKSGVLPARTASGFDLLGSVRGYIEFLRKEPGNLKTERIRYQKLKADLLQLQLAEREDKLVDRDAVKKKLFELQRRNRDAVLNVPPRLAGILAAESDQEKVFQLLTKEMTACMQSLAEAAS